MKMESFLKYYQDELEFLVENGKALAKQHPTIAKTLDFSSFGSNDPDVQRLIESTAFLNAKLQKRIDEQAPELSNAIINALYPQFASPIPSCMIVNFSHINKIVDSNNAKLVPRGTVLTSSKTYSGQYYTFRTTMDVQVTNYEITETSFIKTANANLPNSIYAICDNALYLKLSGGEKKTGPTELVFHIHMLDALALSVYEALLSVFPNKNTPIFEDGKQIGEIEPVGFSDDESLFTGTKLENSGYRVLLEYNAFYKKFLFFRAKFTQAPKKEIVIPFNSKKEIYIKNGDILLNCAPAINCFEKNSEPLSITQKKTSYTIKADNSAEKTTAIHSVLEIADTNLNSTSKYIPYFSSQHLLDNKNHYIFWITKNAYNKTLNDNYDVDISFLDTMPSLEAKVLYAKLLCYQLNAHYIEPDDLWSIEKTPGNLKCRNLDNPTEVILPPMYSRTQWRLISHLAINYFWFENEQALENLKELLAIYDFKGKTQTSAAHALMKMDYATKMRVYSGCILPVVEIDMLADESKPEAFLLAFVLHKFFIGNANFNTKISFILRKNSNRGVWKSSAIK